MTTRLITRSALIAAIYFILTIVLQPLSFGPIQFRISEIMTLLPVLMPESIIGLTVGCLISNIIFSPFGIFDIVFGTLATLVAAILTYFLRRKIILAGLPPVLLNAFIVPLIFLLSGSDAATAGYMFNVMTILIAEAVIVYILGIPVIYALKKVLPLSNINVTKKPN